MLTEAHIRWLAPKAHADYVAALTSAYGWQVMGHYGIVGSSSYVRLAGLMANIIVETGQFTIDRESMAYTSAARLRKVWPGRFGKKTDAELAPLLRNEVALANAVYAGRMGNRPDTNDAFDFRGGGFLQVTGFEDWVKYCKIAGVDILADPTRINDKNVSLVVACAEWQHAGCNEMMDAGAFDDACVVINAGPGALRKVRAGKMTHVGATQSLPERQQAFKLVQKMFGAHTEEVMALPPHDEDQVHWSELDAEQDAEQDEELAATA